MQSEERYIHLVLRNGPVSRSNGIDNLLVNSPDTIPLELNGLLRSALTENVVLETLDSHTTGSYT